MSSDFNCYPKIDLGTQPWSVVSVLKASGDRYQKYVGGDHGGSIPDFELAASTAPTPSPRLSAAVKASNCLVEPNK